MACLMQRHTYEALTESGNVIVPRDIFLNIKSITLIMMIMIIMIESTFDEIRNWRFSIVDTRRCP